MAYDWDAIKREWRTGGHSSARSFERALKADARFEGNAPTHVMISRRMNADKEAGQPWAKDLTLAVEAAVQEKIAMIGATSPDEREAIEQAANTRVAVVVSQRSLGVRLQDAFDRWFNLVNARLEAEERTYKISQIAPSMERCDEIMAMTGRMMLAAERLSKYVSVAFGLEKGWVPNPGDEGGSEDPDGPEDVDKRASHTKDRVAALIALWRSPGPSALGTRDPGVDREPRP